MRPAVHLILAAVGAIACAEPSSSTEPGLKASLYVLDSIAPGPGAIVLAETDGDTLTTYQAIDFDSLTVAAQTSTDF